MDVFDFIMKGVLGFLEFISWIVDGVYLSLSIEHSRRKMKKMIKEKQGLSKHLKKSHFVFDRRRLLRAYVEADDSDTVESLLHENGKNLDAWTLLNGPKDRIKNAPGTDRGKSRVKGAEKYLKYFTCAKCGGKKYRKDQLIVWRYAHPPKKVKGFRSFSGPVGYRVTCPINHTLLDIAPL